MIIVIKMMVIFLTDMKTLKEYKDIGNKDSRLNYVDLQDKKMIWKA